MGEEGGTEGRRLGGRLGGRAGGREGSWKERKLGGREVKGGKRRGEKEEEWYRKKGMYGRDGPRVSLISPANSLQQKSMPAPVLVVLVVVMIE